MTQALTTALLVKEKEDEPVVANRLEAADTVMDVGGSDCFVGLECFLNIVRALGMGSCLSVSHPHPYSPESTSDSAKRRRRLRSGSSFDYKTELRLHKIPGRMFVNGSSEVASLFCKQGKKGINQDAMLVWENFCTKDTIFCGVFDGHGPSGHRVARRVRDSFPLKLIAQWELHHNNNDGLSDSRNAMANHKSEEIGLRMVGEKPSLTDHENNCTNTLKALKESFLKASKIMDKELKLHPDIDCFCSGTTAVTLVKQGQDLVIGNVGDSRAVLGTKDHDNSLIAVQLTIDLKPNLPREEARIKRYRGRVFALRNEPEVARVWLPNIDSPGLAMARAFGDFMLKDFGLISVPDVSHHRLTEKDEFVVLATDGIWDVLSNQEVVDIVASASRSSAARTLVETAVRTWRTKYPTSKIDDCAVVCLFFDSDSDLKIVYSADKETPEASTNHQSEESAPETGVNYSEKSIASRENFPTLGNKGDGVEAVQQQ